MEIPLHSKPLKAKIFSLVTLLLCLPLVEGNASPHHLVNMTWLVYNPETRSLLNSSSNIAPKGTWWPELTFDLCVLAADTNGFQGQPLSDFIESPRFGALGLFDWAFQRDTPCTEPTPVYVRDRVREKRGVRAKMRDVGELVLFLAALRDVKLQERSIGSPVPSKTSFR